jgi:hypothetical protein
VIRNAVTQAEARDGSRSLVGSHVCKIIEVYSGNRLWMYGTISDCEWDEHESMAIFYLATSEDDPLIPVKCPAGAWLILDMPWKWRDQRHTWRVHIQKVRRGHPWKGRG